MRVPFHTCDVFTNRRFGGNPLAVLPEATGLSDAQMLQVTREFGYSETTFVLPPEAGGTRKVRIFTPTGEIPFAGHPNLGTAFALAASGALGELPAEWTVHFEEEAGVVPVEIRSRDGIPQSCELRAPEPLTLGKPVAVEQVASLLGLAPEDVRSTTHPPQRASVGLPFTFVELASREALERIRVDAARFDALGEAAATHAYVRSDDEFDLRARVFVPNAEDPATGSANAALAALLGQLDPTPEGMLRWTIAQGVEMGRPSRLDARVEKRGGSVVATWVAGECVSVSDGEIRVD